MNGMLKRISHVCLGAIDLEAHHEFFCGLLDCKVMHEFRNAKGERYGFILSAGDGAMIEIFRQDTMTDQPSVFRHICFQVHDLEALAGRLRGKGYEVEIRHGRTDNVPQFFIKGPDNLAVEFHQYEDSNASYLDYLTARNG